MSHEPVNLTELRRRAEAAIQLAQSSPATLAAIQPGQLIEELHIYQTELEIQNRELGEAHARNLQLLNKYQTLYDHLPLPALLLDARGFIVEANVEAVAFLGLSHLAERQHSSILHYFDLDGRAEIFPRLQDRSNPAPLTLNQLAVRVAAGGVLPCAVHLLHLPTEAEPAGRTLLVLADQSLHLALHESEHNFRHLADSSSALIWATNPDQVCVFVNRGWREFTGCRDAAIPANAWLAWLHPADRPRCLAAQAQGYAAREPFRVDFRLRNAQGDYRWVRDNSTPRHDSQGQFIGFIDHALDITDRVLAEQLARENAQRYRDLSATLEQQVAARTAELAAREQQFRQQSQRLQEVIWATDIGTWEWDIAEGALHLNERGATLLGHNLDALAPVSFDAWRQLIAAEDQEVAADRLRRCLTRDSEFHECEFRMRQREGHWVWLLERGRVVEWDAAGQPLRMSGTQQDITPRKVAELAVQASNTRYDDLVRCIPVGVYTVVLGPCGGMTTFEYLSERCCELLGLDSAAVLADAELAFAGAHPEDRDGLIDANRRAGQRLTPFHWQGRFIVGGKIRWFNLDSTPIELPDGRSRWNGVVMDITEQKLVEMRQQRNEQLLENIGTVAHIGGWELDIASMTPSWTREVYRFHEVSPDTPIQLDQAIRFYAPEARPVLADAIRRAIEEQTPFSLELPFVTATGRQRRVRAIAHPRLQEGRVTALYGTLQDITEQALIEEQLTQLSLAVEQTEESVAITDLEARLQYVNPAFLRHTGYTRAEVLGQNPRILHSGKTPRATYDTLWTHLSQGLPWQGEFFNRRKDGSEYIEWASISPLRRPDGCITHYVAVKQDITERKRIEAALEDARRAAHQASLAKSEFLATMSHEIRTPMNAILGLTQLLERDRLTADQRDLLRKISDAGDGLLHIINDILDFSKIEAGQIRLEQQPFHLATVLSKIETLIAGAARDKDLTLEMPAADQLPGPLTGDPLRLKQILLNLASNALKFTKQGGIIIRVIPLTVTAATARLRFEVSDTGIGIHPEALARLFQPFIQADASTTRKFGGTGLGLSISKRLVELMGGTIGAASVAGAGSTFWFELPFTRAAATLPAAPEHAPNLPEGPHLAGLRVLAVDDNRINLFMLERALQLEGAVVQLAADGQQALQMLRTQPEGFDVVLMDVQMPVMDGLTATRAIRKDPALASLPVFALTAGVMAEERAAALDAGVNDFIPKPLDIRQMTALLSRHVPGA